jgi:hypothetical protein
MNDTTKAAADALDGIMHAVLRSQIAYAWGRIEDSKAHDDHVRAAIEAAIERARADERMKCAKVCEAISDQYREREGLRYPEMRTDAETGAGECAAAIEALGTTMINGQAKHQGINDVGALYTHPLGTKEGEHHD